ncbi:TPA: hypothetical protein MH350_09860, partial [Klebsiella pneumoniae]|nr:hypothetical protein [Klebsiella pneumoniae]
MKAMLLDLFIIKTVPELQLWWPHLLQPRSQSCSGKMTARNWPPLLMMTAPARWHWMRGAGYLLLTRQKTSAKRLGKPVMTG